MEITWNVKDAGNSLNWAITSIRNNYKATCSASKLSLPDKIVAYRKIQPVFDQIRGIVKQIEGAYGLDRDALNYVHTSLRRELAALLEAHFTIAPRRGYSVVTFKE